MNLLLFYVEAIPEALMAAPEPMAILLWGCALLLLSLKLPSGKSVASDSLAFTPPAPDRALVKA
jgi:hypothetical protein